MKVKILLICLMFMLFQELLAQKSAVSGKVTDSFGEPVPGATVVVKGTLKGVSTDAEGVFSIDVEANSILVVSSIGYKTVEIRVNSANDIANIVLATSEEQLEEFVIVGYGTAQKRESLTGALQKVDGKLLRDITTTSVENMLSAKAAGVFVTPGSGRPGSSGSVVIRGQATLSGTTNPLWVIDGVIVGSSPGELNPDDVASLTVLKDAASTAIYGSQGANGVVVVTTRSAKSNQFRVSISSKVGFNQLTNGNLEVMNGSELYDYFNSFSNADGIRFTRWMPELRNSNYDWWKSATRTGFLQNHNVSVEGGTEKMKSIFSAGIFNELGAVKGYEYTRYNFRLKNEYAPVKWLTVKPMVAFSKTDVDNREHSTGAMYSNLPWDSPYDANGNLIGHRNQAWVNSATGTNYLYDLQWNHSGSANYEFMGNFDFDIMLTNWLTFSSVNNYRFTTYAADSYADPRSNGGMSVEGRITDYRSTTARRYTNQFLRFNRTWDKHAVNGIVGYEFNDYWGKTLDAYGVGIIPGFQVLDVTSKPERARGGISEWAVQSMLSNVNYSYDNKYLAQASLRRDGASNFGDNNKYGNFYSISAGWNIHREDWFDVKWINALKLRTAYGTTGNRPSSLYPQYDLYSVSANYNGNAAALISQIGNKDLTWERTYTSGIGLDASMFDNRLWFNFDLYDKKTDNVLYQVPISGLTGVTSMWRNIGEMNNKGIELTIGGDVVRTNDLVWSISANIGRNVNKLVKLYQTKDAEGNFITRPIIIGDNLGIAGSAQRVLEPGLPVDTYYLKQWAGVNPDNGLPMWYRVTRDADGNEIERTTTSSYAQGTFEKLMKASPDFFGGFTTNLQWKNFDVNAVFGFSVGGYSYSYFRTEFDSDGAYTDRNQMKLMDGWNRWQKPGDIATHPIATYGNQNNGNSASSRFIESNDFLRLRSLNLGYTINLPKWKIKNARLFFAGENLFTITNYSGVDPEIPVLGSGGTSSSAGPSIYPMTKKYTFGLNLSF
jgi:TonB-linked SusC/RagA family outer membrane protein